MTEVEYKLKVVTGYQHYVDHRCPEAVRGGKCSAQGKGLLKICLQCIQRAEAKDPFYDIDKGGKA